MNKNIGSADRRLSTLIVTIAVVIATLVPGTSWATGTTTTRATATMRSTAFATNTYGLGAVSGKANLRAKDGRLRIEAEVQGLKPGTSHIGHVHLGDCNGLVPGEIIHDLTTVKIGRDGKGHSVTFIRDAIEASLAAVQDCGWWVAFHEGPAKSNAQSPAVAIGPVLRQQR